MTPQALLAAHNIHLASTAPGRYYTICPQCSAKRSNAHQKNKVLGVTITADDSVHWGCNHCGWIGPENGTGNGRGGNNLTTYDYQDASGTVTFQKVRAYDKNGEKFFWLRKPDGNGGWIKDTAGVDTKVLYRLPEIVEAVANGQTIAVVEGEKDANNLWRIGIPATCNAQGASELGKRPKWIRGHSEHRRAQRQRCAWLCPRRRDLHSVARHCQARAPTRPGIALAKHAGQGRRVRLVGGRA
jgi:hypothetical protein